MVPTARICGVASPAAAAARPGYAAAIRASPAIVAIVTSAPIRAAPSPSQAIAVISALASRSTMAPKERPERRRSELIELASLINEQLWVGHFDVWGSDGIIMFRHALLLTGGVAPSDSQCEALLGIALDACERHYQAFQFVLWAGKSPRNALESTLFETSGEA